MKAFLVFVLLLMSSAVYAQQPPNPERGGYDIQRQYNDRGYYTDGSGRCYYSWQQYRHDKRMCYGDDRCERRVERRRDRCRMTSRS